VALFVAARIAQRQGAQPLHDDRAVLSSGHAELLEIDSNATLYVRQRDEQGVDRRLPVRLLGVTIMSEHAPAAAECVRRELQSAHVRIELDQRRIDAERRFLAYVYHEETLLNELVIREGWATAENYPGDSLPIARRLRAAEQDAREHYRGMWRE
jgi:endonuclease YncB( thermonuclease family)